MLDMSEEPFEPQARAKKYVTEYWNTKMQTRVDISPSDIFVVWFAYILGGWKCVLSSPEFDSGSYFEVTYNLGNQETYLDYYIKEENVCLPDTADYRLAKLRNKFSK